MSFGFFLLTLLRLHASMQFNGHSLLDHNIYNVPPMTPVFQFSRPRYIDLNNTRASDPAIDSTARVLQTQPRRRSIQPRPDHHRTYRYLVNPHKILSPDVS